MAVEKTSTVLKRSENGYTAYSNFVPFEYLSEETGVIEWTVILSRRVTDDLGWPSEITVTIEPGDKLNETKVEG